MQKSEQKALNCNLKQRLKKRQKLSRLLKTRAKLSQKSKRVKAKTRLRRSNHQIKRKSGSSKLNLRLILRKLQSSLASWLRSICRRFHHLSWIAWIGKLKIRSSHRKVIKPIRSQTYLKRQFQLLAQIKRLYKLPNRVHHSWLGQLLKRKSMRNRVYKAQDLQ